MAKTPTPQPPSPIPFFIGIWDARPNFPTPTTLQAAVSQLRVSAKLNRAQLAKRLFVTESVVIRLESHGQPESQKIVDRLKFLSDEYRFTSLSRFFSDRIMGLKVKQHRRLKQ